MGYFYLLCLLILLPAPFSISLIIIATPLIAFQTICPMQPIQNSDRPIVHIELLMMRVVHLRLPVKEVISTMYRCRIEELPGEIRPEHQDMAAQDLPG